MIVECGTCGKRYKVNEAKMTASRMTTKCMACNQDIDVVVPDWKDQVDESSVKTELNRQLDPSSDLNAGNRQKESQWGDQDTIGLLAKEQQKTRRLGLTGKIVLLMLIVSLIPLISFWGLSFQQTSSRIRTDTENLGAKVSDGLVSHVDEWIDKNLLVLKAMAKTPQIISMSQMVQEPVLKAIQSEYPWMYLVFTIDANGVNISRSDGKPPKDYSDRNYYKRVMAGESIAWQTLIGKTSKKPALVLAVPIIRDGKVAGVLANAMQIDQVSDKIATWKAGDTGYAFLVDNTGKVVAHQVKSFAEEEKNLNDHPLIKAHKSGQKGAIYFKNEQQKPTIGHIRETRYGWILGIQQEEDEAFAILKKAQNLTYVLLASTALLVIIIASLAGRGIVKPIIKLTEAANNISMGDLDADTRVDSNDEIGDMADAVARMQDSLRISISRLRRKVRS